MEVVASCPPSSFLMASAVDNRASPAARLVCSYRVNRSKEVNVARIVSVDTGYSFQRQQYASDYRLSYCKLVAFLERASKDNFRSQPLSLINDLSSQSCLLLANCWNRNSHNCGSSQNSLAVLQDKFRRLLCSGFFRVALGFLVITSLSLAVDKTPAWSLTEENLLFLEAWRTIDRAYVDKTFNGQSWFRYREEALRNEPMNTREETYTAIRKMLATLGDPFTRFLEPVRFKNLRSGTQGALTGVGLSISYPMGLNASSSGLVVMSSTPGGPANRDGILPGDVILEIDGVKTEEMDIYNAAERLQGPEASLVELVVQSGNKVRHVKLVRERLTLNPVQSRLCEISGPGNDVSRIGYIKLSTFNVNASGSVKQAIEKLRSSNVNAFVLDLRDNNGGLFPEGIAVAKIWLEKGVIVYICDSRGVRDIYEADGTDVVATSEPLVVLVNKGTASASEILAGALKDNKRAILYGEPTYGKGKIQSVFELSDGSGIVVTVARYETPAHTDIDKVGVLPDRPLPASFPLDEDGFCSCLKDVSSPCNLNSAKLFAR